MDWDKHFNLVKEITDKTEEEVNKLEPVTILVAGKTGTGKSTLINHLFREKLADTGVGKPVTKHFRKITKKGVPLILYDTRGFELDPVIQQNIKKELMELIQTNQQKKEPIDAAYYCIQAHAARIEESEIEFITELSKKLPVLIVLTQAFGEPTKTFKSYIEQLNLPVAGVHSVLAEAYPISEDYVLPQFGLEELVSRTMEVIPDKKKDAFNNAQQGDLSRKAKAARKWTARYIATSFGIGFVPIPFSDASLLVPMQVTLLAHITAIFGVSVDKSTLVSLIAAVGGTGSATYIGRSLVTQALKFIPGAGTLVGGLISGTTAAAMTSALSYSYIEVLTVIARGEKEGTQFDVKELQQMMKNSFEKQLKKKHHLIPGKQEKRKTKPDHSSKEDNDTHKTNGVFSRFGKAVKRIPLSPFNRKKNSH